MSVFRTLEPLGPSKPGLEDLPSENALDLEATSNTADDTYCRHDNSFEFPLLEEMLGRQFLSSLSPSLHSISHPLAEVGMAETVCTLRQRGSLGRVTLLQVCFSVRVEAHPLRNVR